MIDIKLFRKDNNLSQIELASILGCTQGFISSIERNKRPVPDNIITKLLSIGKFNTRHLIQENSNELEEVKSNINDEVKMSREVFDVLKNLSETVLSQQRTIEQIHSEKEKTIAQQESNVICASASGSDLAR